MYTCIHLPINYFLPIWVFLELFSSIHVFILLCHITRAFLDSVHTLKSIYTLLSTNRAIFGAVHVHACIHVLFRIIYGFFSALCTCIQVITPLYILLLIAFLGAVHEHTCINIQLHVTRGFSS